MSRFVVAGLVATAVVAVGGWWAADHAARQEAVEDARQRTITLAASVVTPAVSDALVDGGSRARTVFDRTMRERVLGGDVVRVKLWTTDGRIVYSDVAALVGARFELDEEEREAITSGEAAAEESDLRRPENQYDAGHGPLLEVYLPVRTPSGRVLLFETYQKESAVDARSREVLAEFAPIMLGGLLVLLGALVPVAWSQARRIELARAERERLLRHALEASTTERRRIAAHLHDGIVQSLAGSSYALAGVADSLGDGRHRWAAEVVNETAAELRQNVRGLRSLLVEIYPPGMRGAGLVPALSDLTAQLSSRGLVVDLDLPGGSDLGDEVEVALFRVAQEAVRNIVKHAGARQVRVSLRAEGDVVVLVVGDDGRGFDPGKSQQTATAGHLGMILLEDVANEVGGEVSVESRPGAGTVVTARIPVP